MAELVEGIVRFVELVVPLVRGVATPEQIARVEAVLRTDGESRKFVRTHGG